MSKPLILITNDDGYKAKGIRYLIKAVEQVGDIIVVAPEKPQSGMGHAITVNDPVRCFEIDFFKRDLELTDDQIIGFLEYIDDNLPSQKLLSQSKQFQLIDYLILESKKYRNKF